jgi:hypothetical protein
MEKLVLIGNNDNYPKEQLFNWIVDLTQQQFDDLCNEIMAFYTFRFTYEGVLVTDEESLIRSFTEILPVTEFIVDRSVKNYQKKYFYQGLSVISQQELNTFCKEIVSLRAHVEDNRDLYIVSTILPAVKHIIEYWRVLYVPLPNVPDLRKFIRGLIISSSSNH